MEKMDILESGEGMLLHVPHQPNGFRIHGTIVNVCADTKGAHEFDGFISPFADRFCRICLIQWKIIMPHPTARNVEMRNINNYIIGTEAVENTVNGDSGTGIRSNCFLNKSRFYHVGEDQTLDCMHDFLEGVDSFISMLVLRKIMTKHKDLEFAAQFIKSRINFFEYGRSDQSNRPSAKFTDQSL